MQNTEKVAIIGCGNPKRADDGVGPHVIELLRQCDLPANVALFDAGTDGLGVMYQARGANQLIIIDAREAENCPGTIYEVPGDYLAAEPVHGIGLHAFRWDHALFIGRKIYQDDFPERVSVFLIESETLQYRVGLSDPVAKSARTVADRVCAMLNAPASTTRTPAEK